MSSHIIFNFIFSTILKETHYLQSTRHAFHFKELRYSSFTQPEVQPAQSVAHRLGRKSKEDIGSYGSPVQCIFPVLFAKRCPTPFLATNHHFVGFCCCQDAAKNPYPGFEGPQFPRKRGSSASKKLTFTQRRIHGLRRKRSF